MFPFDYIPEGKKAVREGSTWKIVDLDKEEKTDALILLEQANLKIAEMTEKIAKLEAASGENGAALNMSLRDDLEAMSAEIEQLRNENESLRNTVQASKRPERVIRKPKGSPDQ